MRIALIIISLLLAGCSNPQGNDNWSFDTSKDKITDKETFLAIAHSKSGRGGFVITCDARARGLLKPTVIADRPLLDRGNPRMFVLRIDSEPAIFSRWEVARDVAVLNPVDEGIEHLAAYIASGSNLVVRMQTVDGRDFDMEFNVRGLQKAIDWMTTRCRS